LEGSRLVLASLGLFLFPLLSALAGAVLAGEGGWSQLFAALGGFAAALLFMKGLLLVLEGRRGR